MSDCLFCRIAEGKIPAAVLAADEHVVSFLDIRPVNPGHALVVPRRHADDLMGLTEGEMLAAMAMVRRVASAVVQATGSAGFHVLQNNGEAAGQVVRHAHFHVIPRRPGDGFDPGWRQIEPEAGQLEALQEAIRRLL
ncbi:MAG: HIT family protein [Candidatus Brocadiaceae bacterium]|mgnify:CR=1 FL=1|nr:HIT family protein [Candidatus Brocadiaceae bacterium]